MRVFINLGIFQEFGGLIFIMVESAGYGELC